MAFRHLIIFLFWTLTQNSLISFSHISLYLAFFFFFLFHFALGLLFNRRLGVLLIHLGYCFLFLPLGSLGAANFLFICFSLWVSVPRFFFLFFPFSLGLFETYFSVL